MKHMNTIVIPCALALLISGPSAMAQDMSGKPQAGRTTGPGYEVTAEMQRYREMASVMRDMSQQLDKMQGDMKKNEMSPDARNRMQQRLSEMSEMMRRMSGLADRPSMNDPENQKQIREMRKQMDTMMRSQR
jgi:hypothetical protein